VIRLNAYEAMSGLTGPGSTVQVATDRTSQTLPCWSPSIGSYVERLATMFAGLYGPGDAYHSVILLSYLMHQSKSVSRCLGRLRWEADLLPVRILTDTG